MPAVQLPEHGILARILHLTETIVIPPEAAEKDGSARPWYGSEWLWLALAALSTLPFLLSPLPPLGDLFSHMARYHVAQTYEQSASLQRYYDFRWTLLPNLGQDLLMVPFGRVFGVERGAMILSALIPALSILAIRALSVAVHGRVQPLALLAVPFTYSFTFLFGFMNYNTGLVVLLWSTVLWYRLQNASVPVRAAVFAALATACWICHLAAWALFVVAIGSLELVRVLQSRDVLRGGARGVVAAGLAALPMAVAVMLPALLSWYTHVDGTVTPPGAGSSWLLTKIIYLRWALRDESALVDAVSLLLIIAVPAWLALRRHLRVDAAMGLFAVAVFVMYWAIPTAFNNAFYADVRLVPIIYIAALLACRDTLSPRARTAIALGAIALFAGRMALTTHGWVDRGTSLRQELGALDKVPVGARLASAEPSRTCETWQNDGLATLASFALLRRDAYVTTMWNIPGQQILQPTYLKAADTPRTNLGYHRCSGMLVDQWLAAFPRDKFDFVWLFKVQPSAAAMAWLTPVYRGPQGVLYAVRHDPAAAIQGVRKRT